MRATGSISKGKLATKHNLRSCYDARNCPPNIDLSRSAENEVLVSRDIADVYAEAFGEAQAAYNAAQVAKRHPERQISDYLEHVRADKKLNEAYEFVVQVGNIDERPPEALCAAILRDFETEFEKEHGEHFRVVQAVIHMDEATPHMHMQVVPVAESKRGLAVQNSLNKAIEQAGFVDYKSMLLAWDETLTECMAAHDVERVDGDRERQRGGVDIDTYRKAMRLAETYDAAKREADAELAETRAEIEAAKARLESVRQREREAGERHSELVGRLGNLQGRKWFEAEHPETLSEGARALAGTRGIGERESVVRERNKGLRERISELRRRIGQLIHANRAARSRAETLAVEAGERRADARLYDRLVAAGDGLRARIDELERRNEPARGRVAELGKRKSELERRNGLLRQSLPRRRAAVARVENVLASSSEGRAAWKRDYLERRARKGNSPKKKQAHESTGPSRRGPATRGQEQSRGRSR